MFFACGKREDAIWKATQSLLNLSSYLHAYLQMLRQKCGKRLFLNSSVKALLTPHGKHWQIVDLEMILLICQITSFFFFLCFYYWRHLCENRIFWFLSFVWQSSHSGKDFKAKPRNGGIRNQKQLFLTSFISKGFATDSLLCN